MLTFVAGGTEIREPLIGAHLGLSLGTLLGLPVDTDPLLIERMASRSDYFFAEEARDAWAPALRALLLARIARSVAATTGPLIVKEPWGSTGASILMSVLPESWLLFLLRDGRDVVDSLLDGANEGWITHALGAHLGDRETALRQASLMWVRNIRAVGAAYDRHDPQRRLIVTYERLCADTESEVERIMSWLGRPSNVLDIRNIIDRTTPRGRQGNTVRHGRFVRAAQPGLWQDHFTANEAAIAEEIMGTTLTEYGYKTKQP